MKENTVELDICPLCGNKHLKPLHEVMDWRGSGESFQLLECDSCHFVMTSPRPSDDQLGKYYPKDDYVSHTDKPKGLFDKVYFQVQKRNLKDKLKKIRKFISQGELLDYGCGAGSFIYFMQQNGWRVQGVELSDEAAKIARQRTGSSVTSPNDFKAPQGTFDLITLWHVLEHLPELETRMTDFFSWLKPGGYLYLALPNHRSYDAREYGTEWAAWDVPIHLWHFNRSSIQRLADKFGLNWVETFPMPFDAYYVSMISAKNQKRNLWQADGLKVGLKSNQLAKQNGEASSLIYVLQKPQ
jgi:SAM-dependent methyltransferase